MSRSRADVVARAEQRVAECRERLEGWQAKFAERLEAGDPGYALTWSAGAFESAAGLAVWSEVLRWFRDSPAHDDTLMQIAKEQASDHAMAANPRSTSPTTNLLADETRAAWVSVHRFLTRSI